MNKQVNKHTNVQSPKRAHRQCTLAFGLLVAAMMPRVVIGADGADHLNLQEPKRPDYVAPGPKGGFELPPVVPSPAAPGMTGEVVLINRIAFRGNTVIGIGELDNVAAPYIGRQVDMAEIEELRQKLSRYYIDRGYINSGALLWQDAFANGTLTFDIVEGRLKAIQLRGLERLHEDYVGKRLVSDINAPLNIDRLRERFQLLLGDPLIDRLNARLIPDTKLGEAILDVDVARARPYQLTAIVNNYRPPSIGSTGVALNGWVRNLTGYGDFLESSLQDSTRLGEGSRSSLGWQVPLNNRGTLLSAQLDHGRSAVIEEPMQSLDIRSTLDTKDLGLSQNFIETLSHKLTAGVNRVRRENRTSLLGNAFSFVPGEPNGVTKILAWRFWQEYSYRSETQVLALRSTFTSARNNLQDIEGLPPTGNQADRQYVLWLGQVQYARQVLDNGAQFIARGSLQQTNRHLLALDQVSIGGASTVRGYRENQLIRDKGGILSVEFEYPLISNSGDGMNLSLIPFYDYGRGKNQNESADMLSSMGFVTRMQWKGLSLNLALARRLAHSDVLNNPGGTLQDKGIHFQLGYRFFGN